MKKIIAIIILIYLCVFTSACGNRTNISGGSQQSTDELSNVTTYVSIGPEASVTLINTVTTEEVTIDDAFVDALLPILNTNWDFDITKTTADYCFVINGDQKLYYSQYGIFNDRDNRRHLSLSEEEMRIINSFIYDLFEEFESKNFLNISDLNLKSMQSYKYWYNMGVFPDDFVGYEKISRFGDFGTLVLENTDCSSYTYTLTNIQDYPIHLYVGEKMTAESFKQINVSSVKEDDMRTLYTNEYGVYTYNGINYEYADGKLVAVFWSGGGRMYKVSTPKGFLNFPLGDTEDVSKLLNLQTSYETVSSMFGAVDQ